jgi:hypothetical protein
MRLSSTHRVWFYASFALLLASGTLWVVFHYFIRVRGEFGVVAHPLQIWWLRLHGAAAMLSVAVLGSLLPIHVRRHWHQGKNRLAGTVAGAIALLLIVTGYALYYLSSEALRPWISTGHWLLGLAALPLLLVHIHSGRRSVASAAPSASLGVSQHNPEPVD